MAQPAAAPAAPLTATHALWPRAMASGGGIRLASKQSKKKDITPVDHSKITYEVGAPGRQRSP